MHAALQGLYQIPDHQFIAAGKVLAHHCLEAVGDELQQLFVAKSGFDESLHFEFVCEQLVDVSCCDELVRVVYKLLEAMLQHGYPVDPAEELPEEFEILPLLVADEVV